MYDGIYYAGVYRPKDAIRAIKKKIVGNKNFREVMLALTVRFRFSLSSFPLFLSVLNRFLYVLK